MRPLRILITTVGGLTSPDIIRALRDNGERDVWILGVDPHRHAVGRGFTDRFFTVPDSGIDPEAFSQSVKALAQEFRVDVVVPCGNEDNLALAASGTSEVPVMVGALKDLRRAYDKKTVYERLAAGFPSHAPKFFSVTNVEELLRAAEALGYPNRDVVIKPRTGRGGRGVLRLTADPNLADVLTRKNDGFMPLAAFVHILERGQPTDLLAMECLSEPFYSIYALSDNGNVLASVVHEREWGTASQTYRGAVQERTDLDAMSAWLGTEFNLSFAVNFEVATTEDGQLALFDLNPRLAASSGVAAGLGVNLPYLALKLFLGEPIGPINVRKLYGRRFFRHLQHYWD